MYRGRIVVDARPLDAEVFAALVEEVLPIADRIAPRLGPPTEFELLTAVMFLHFARSRLDLALVEVGLGGRLDATNAWDGGVAVLTNVGLDHVAQLGPTVGAIAREKVQIVKRGNVVVTGADGEALAILRRRCARLGVPLEVRRPAPVLGWDRDVLRVDLPGLGPVAIGLRGRHQAANVAVADGLLDALEAAGRATVPADARRRGYANARWPGRLELLEVAGREVLLDGAHNEDGARALARALDDLVPFLRPGPLTLVWAAMADKDIGATVRAMAASPALDMATVVCTAVDAPRALAPEALAEAWRAGAAALGRTVHVRAVQPPAAALEEAFGTGDGAIVVAGSLYLVGEARLRLVDDPLLRDPVAT
jgi:dihydrofolate synthase / folylpolyglutamate synthase